jgi:hypothetical protein
MKLAVRRAMELPLDVKLFINATGSTRAELIAIIISDGRDEDDDDCDAEEDDSWSVAVEVAGITKLVNRWDIKLSVSRGDISFKKFGNEQIPLVNDDALLLVVDDDVVVVVSCSCFGPSSPPSPLFVFGPSFGGLDDSDPKAKNGSNDPGREA